MIIMIIIIIIIIYCRAYSPGPWAEGCAPGRRQEAVEKL